METSKACQDTDIQTKVIKENVDIFPDILLASTNDSVKKSNFQSSIKKANITLVFKKGGINFKDNYRPVSILPNVSKIISARYFSSIMQVL